MITLLVVFLGNVVKEGTAVEIKTVREKLELQGIQFDDNYYN